MSQALPDSSALSEMLSRVSSQKRADASAYLRARAGRIKSIVAEHYAFLWRSLRRLGVPEVDVEDAAQKCLWVVAQRIDDVPCGKEKTFLFGVAARIAKAEWRRSQSARSSAGEECLAELPARGPDPADQLDERRARVLLDTLLDALPTDLRTVFVLYELEELTMAEIAAALEIPCGTVASRLRRSREAFEVLALRLQKRLSEKREPR